MFYSFRSQKPFRFDFPFRFCNYFWAWPIRPNKKRKLDFSVSLWVSSTRFQENDDGNVLLKTIMYKIIKFKWIILNNSARFNGSCFWASPSRAAYFRVIFKSKTKSSVAILVGFPLIPFLLNRVHISWLGSHRPKHLLQSKFPYV